MAIIIPMAIMPLVPHTSPGNARPLVALGYAAYGMGFLLFLLVLGLLHDRLVLHPLPPAPLAPTMWIGLGPVGVAALAPLALARAGQERWGGEEFLALLPGTDPESLYAAAERVRMLSENSWIQRGDAQVRVTVSVGATMGEPGETPDDLVDRADTFMYASKRAGRNRVTTDSGELTSKAGRPILGTAVPWETPA